MLEAIDDTWVRAFDRTQPPDSPLRAPHYVAPGASSRAAASSGGESRTGGAGPRPVPNGLAGRQLALQPIQADGATY